MERLTRRMCGGFGVVSGYELDTVRGAKAVIDRLAAYEDTGLEPEEITTEPYGCVFYCNRKCNLYGDFCAEGPGCPDEIGAEAVKHLLELAKAEEGGWLVVLPCKPDATVYQWKKGDDIPSLFRLDGIVVNESGEIAYKTHWGETFSLDDFGETVFFTHEEAEAAMKKRAE